MVTSAWRHAGPTDQRLQRSVVRGGVRRVCGAVVGPEGEMGRFGWLSAHAGFKGFLIFLNSTQINPNKIQMKIKLLTLACISPSIYGLNQLKVLDFREEKKEDILNDFISTQIQIMFLKFHIFTNKQNQGCYRTPPSQESRPLD
jgi:hypothetical protein